MKRLIFILTLILVLTAYAVYWGLGVYFYYLEHHT